MYFDLKPVIELVNAESLEVEAVVKIAKISGTKGFRSARRLDDACRTMTATSNCGRFCSNYKLRSTVIKTSNSTCARARS